MGIRVTGIVIAVALLLPMGVLAQGKASGSASQAKEKVEAKAHYDQGTVHFNLDEWPQAIEEFKDAYRLFPDATFLYNIAQCHRKMGNVAEALSFYKKYQRERPDAPNRAEVEKRIEELEAAKASKAREVPPPPPSAPPTAPPAPRRASGRTCGHAGHRTRSPAGRGARYHTPSRG
jgi:tetratricopeptide (TPR) repeat protein